MKKFFLLWVASLFCSTAMGFSFPTAVTVDTYVPVWWDVQVVNGIDEAPMLTITPVPLPDTPLVPNDAAEIYPTEPYPLVKPTMIPPPSPAMLSSFIEPIPVYPDFGYGGSEMDMYFYQFCESSSENYTCSRYADVVQRLDPKIQELANIIQTKFDEDKQEDIKWMIRDIIEQKFYSVSTEKSKFTISFVWIALQEYLYEEDVEDIDSRLWDAITNLQNNWKIVGISEAPGDMTRIQWDLITSSNNRFGLEIDAQFDSGRPVTPQQWYEVLAYFGKKWSYFLDREDMRYAQYDASSKIWKFDGDQDSYRMWGKVPDVSNVTLYLLCYYCDGEQFNPDRDGQYIADFQDFWFEKLDDNMSYDISLEVSNHTVTQQSEQTLVQLEYVLTNEWTQQIAGIRSNIWAYPLSDGPRYGGDEQVDRVVTNAVCAWDWVSEEDFLDGNIQLESWDSCVITETVTINNRNNNDVDFSVDVEARMDQNQENNNRNEVLEAN